MKQAYCVELDQIIPAYEAWRILFGEEKSKFKHLTFKCPDPHCRVTLLASNLRALSSPSEVYFKTRLKQKHDPFCSYVHAYKELIEITSPEQAKDCLLYALAYLYKHLCNRLEQIEKKVGS